MAIEILGDLRISFSDGAGPLEPRRFGGHTVLIAMDYKPLFSVVPSRKYEEDENGNCK